MAVLLIDTGPNSLMRHFVDAPTLGIRGAARIRAQPRFGAPAAAPTLGPQPFAPMGVALRTRNGWKVVRAEPGSAGEPRFAPEPTSPRPGIPRVGVAVAVSGLSAGGPSQLGEELRAVTASRRPSAARRRQQP